MSVKSRKNPIFHDRNALDEECIAGAFSIGNRRFLQVKSRRKHPKNALFRYTGREQEIL